MKKLFAFILTIQFLLLPACARAQQAWADTVINDQLAINRSALLSSPELKIRVVAAKQLLLAEDDNSRKIILEALGKEGDLEAKKAVCTALIESDTWQKKIVNVQDMIKPVCDLMKTKDGRLAELASQALLIYSYAEVKDCLLAQLKEGNDVHTRLNVITALKLRLPQREVIKSLVEVLDDKSGEVASAAGQALQDWVPLGTDRKSWGAIISELSEKSPQQIVRERLMRQQARLVQLESSLSQLLDKHVASIETIYQGKTEVKEKSDFLITNLKSDFVPIRLWALDKVVQWKSSSVLPEEFAPVLLSLVGDSDSQVRLKVAQLLIYMADINPAKSLLAQVKVEKNPEVARAQLNALGEACYYAYLASSQIKLDPQIKIDTLAIIDKFIQSPDSADVLTGADNLRKLLEKNGFDNSIAQNSLKVLLDRYVKESSANPELSAKLLEKMTKFCESSCFFKSDAASLYNPEFSKALASADPKIRFAAVTGLINVDSAAALKQFKEKELFNDSEKEIQIKVIELAKEVGSADDLSWLSEKLRNGDNRAWPALLSILQRSEPQVVSSWLDKLVAQLGDDKRVYSLLEMAEKKTGLQLKARIRLAGLYKMNKDFENSVKYYNLALELEQDDKSRDSVLLGLLDLYLINNKNYEVSKMVSDRLEKQDISAKDPFAVRLDQFFNNANIDTGRKSMLLALLAVIKNDNEKPQWDEVVSKWKSLLGQDKTEKPGQTGQAVPSNQTPAQPAKAKETAASAKPAESAPKAPAKKPA